MGVVSDFKAFITKGNVIEVAVGIVIGLAFVAVVNAFVLDIITPLISIPGSHDLTTYKAGVGGGMFLYGAFVTAVINFLMVAVVVFFVIVRPMAKMEERHKTHLPAPAPTTRECPYCLSQVPAKATRCAFCTSQLTPSA
jgi:large conductance mechanosensitive channel